MKAKQNFLSAFLRLLKVEIHSKLGGSKKFNCSNCNHKIDRDANGSINIYIKTISGN
ncbi:MAG: zinc ribbon domain-containing protein [Calothrix sp. MO_167.B42]|nr:zinc ribbon domain-containing protein [Calothrix sp. MO_167.B42]